MGGSRTILIATKNPGKAREIAAALSDSRSGDNLPGGDSCRGEAGAIRWVNLSEISLNIEEPEETGTTFAENAALKARYYSKASGLWTLADDSGLEVDALGGEPGVNSAYYAEHASKLGREERDRANNEKLIAALRGIPDTKRSARFRCHLALADGERILATATGAIEGRIVDEPRGEGGFGYDPHFFVAEMGKTTAELTMAEKNRVSHRGKALEAMRSVLPKVISAG